jgi:DnaJ-domain-containing protein 1
MIDYFVLLGEERRPYLDPDLVRKKFLALSGEAHPDRVHGSSTETKNRAQERYAEVNQAYNHLRHPKERLQHLLELETGAKPEQIQRIPAHLMEFFVQVGQLFKQTDAFLAEKSRTTSPLLQVQLFETGQAWVEKLNLLQQQLKVRQQGLLEELRTLDVQWIAQKESDRPSRVDMLGRLEESYQLFSYYTKWESQIQGRIVQLSL